MIKLALVLLPESNISLDQLWRKALPSVIGELAARGYTVAGTSPAGSGDVAEIAGLYQLHPGPATMIVTMDGAAGLLQFVLSGAQFGKRIAEDDTDAVLWMRLVILGMTLRDAHGVVARTTDPEQDDPGLGAT